MLLELRDYMIQKRSANLQEIAWHFKQTPETVRCLLAHWIRKGKVCQSERPPNCGTKCQLCKPANAEIYRWQA
jgi:putative ferrous iron transport protein C